jgi:hypothetical protein
VGFFFVIIYVYLLLLLYLQIKIKVSGVTENTIKLATQIQPKEKDFKLKNNYELTSQFIIVIIVSIYYYYYYRDIGKGIPVGNRTRDFPPYLSATATKKNTTFELLFCLFNIFLLILYYVCNLYKKKKKKNIFCV